MTALPDHTQFLPLLQTQFTVHDGAGNSYAVTLTDVTEKTHSHSHEEYSLFFRGAPEFFLPQGTYGFEHEAIRLFELFIVPVAQDATGYAYQAVISRVATQSTQS
jgi:hypothetical protein